jgi:hypothetical protein
MILRSDKVLDLSLLRLEKLRATLPGQLADHELLRPIAAGSCGDVWLARSLLTGVFRALKIVWRDAFDTPRPYEREFEAIKRFEPISRTQPGFVHILHTGRLENGFYYIMELADDLEHGQQIDVREYNPATLGAKRPLRMPVEEVVRIGISLAESLDALHGAGLIHRDIKPSNVIFVQGRPKLADIGLVIEASAANSLVGTNGFIAPEGPTSNRADIYSLGKLLYEIATGLDRLEFPKLPESISLGEALLLEMNHILLKACDPDPRLRYGSVRELKFELELLFQGRSIRRVRQLEHAVRWLRASLATICISVVAGFFLLKSQQARREAASQILERRIGSALAQGNERVRTGDYLAALNCFAQAALLDSADSAEHRLRIGSALASAPAIIASFKSDSEEACFSAHAKLLATLVSGKIRLTDLASRQVVREFEREANVLALDPVGRTLAVGHTNSNTLTLIDLVASTETQVHLPAPLWHVSLLSATNYAVTLLSGKAYLFPGALEILPVSDAIYKTVLSPSGQHICVLEKSGHLRVTDRQRVELFAGDHKSLPYSALFSADESTLFTSSFDYTALAWDIQSGRQIGLPMEHADGVRGVAISPDASLIATASLDRTVKLWQRSTFTPVAENHLLYHPEAVVWVQFVSNSSLLVHCIDGASFLWSLNLEPQWREEQPRSFDLPAREVFVDGATRLYAEGCQVSGTVDRSPFSVTLSGPVQTISVDPAHRLVAIGTRDDSRARHSVRLFNSRGVPVGRPMEHKDGITYVTFSHSGELIGSCSEDFTARVWDRLGNPVTLALKHKNQARWLSFTDDDRWVVTGSWDKTVRVWNARTGVPVTVPLKIGNLVDYVCFRGTSELFIANQKRNYLLRLPFFDGDIRPLLKSGPIDNEQF